jgi:DNA-binding response OmpR family regulator
MKSDERTDHISVIMLTARADIDIKPEGLELGANAYLPPLEKQELLLTIRNLFEFRAEGRFKAVNARLSGRQACLSANKLAFLHTIRAVRRSSACHIIQSSSRLTTLIASSPPALTRNKPIIHRPVDIFLSIDQFTAVFNS